MPSYFTPEEVDAFIATAMYKGMIYGVIGAIFFGLLIFRIAPRKRLVDQAIDTAFKEHVAAARTMRDQKILDTLTDVRREVSTELKKLRLVP